MLRHFRIRPGVSNQLGNGGGRAMRQAAHGSLPLAEHEIRRPGRIARQAGLIHQSDEPPFFADQDIRGGTGKQRSRERKTGTDQRKAGKPQPASQQYQDHEARSGDQRGLQWDLPDTDVTPQSLDIVGDRDNRREPLPHNLQRPCIEPKRHQQHGHQTGGHYHQRHQGHGEQIGQQSACRNPVEMVSRKQPCGKARHQGCDGQPDEPLCQNHHSARQPGPAFWNALYLRVLAAAA